MGKIHHQAAPVSTNEEKKKSNLHYGSKLFEEVSPSG